MKRASWLLLFPLLLSVYSCSRDPKVVARKYIENGNKYYDKGKYKEASIMYRRALQSDVRSGEAWYRLGLADLGLRNGGAAMKDFSHSTEIDPKMEKAYTKDAYARMGNIYMAAVIKYSAIRDEKTRKIAIEELRKVTEILEKDKKSFDFLRFSGFLAQADGKPAGKAIDYYEQANQVKPDQPEILTALAELSFMNKQADLGEKYCRRLIAKNKTLSQPYDVLARYYANNNQLGPAEQVLKEKIANNPDQGAYLLELAGFYYQTNRKSDMTATLARVTSDLKKYPNAHFLVGDFYFQGGDLDNAAQQYQQGQKDSPKEKALYEKRIIQVLSVQNKNDEAFKVVADLLKDNPKDPEAIAAHAALLLHSGKRDQIRTVIDELKPLAAKPPTNTSPTLHYNLGLAYQANYQNTRNKENLEPARLQFQEAINLRSDYAAAMIGLAEIELERGDNRKAVQIIDGVISKDPRIARTLKAHLIHTMGLMNMGERDKARVELNEVLKAMPGSQDARYQLASLDLAERRLKEAQDEFETLRKAGDPRGLIGLIEVKVAQKDNDGAIAMVREQLKQTPDRSEYQLALANIEYRAGKMSDAATDYQKLIDKNPKVTDLYLRLGETRRYSGDLKAAEAAFKKAHEVAPSDTMPLIQLGLLYDTSGRNPEARKTYEEVLKIQPDNPVALNNLAYAIADEGADLDQALNYAQRAQQKLPQNQDVIDTLGLIYIRKNLTDDGVRLLKDLVARNPDRSAYHLHLAMGYYKQGNRSAARKELDAASRDKPSDKEQVRIKEMMAKVG